MDVPVLDRLTGLPRGQQHGIALGGLALFALALIFLDWFGSIRMTTITDSWWIVLIVVVVTALWHLSEVLGFTSPITGITPGRALMATLLVLTWTTTYLIDLPERGVGAWVGFVGAAAGAFGTWLVARGR